MGKPRGQKGERSCVAKMAGLYKEEQGGARAA